MAESCPENCQENPTVVHESLYMTSVEKGKVLFPQLIPPH